MNDYICSQKIILMIHFINNVLKYKSLFHIIDIPYRDIHLIQKKVINDLKLNNLNQLRDKFEGEQYYKNNLHKCLPILALEKLFTKRIFDWDNLDLKSIQSVLTIENTKVYLKLCEYGKTPEVEKDIDGPVIFFVYDDKKEVWICGLAGKETISKFQGKERTIGIGSRAKRVVEFIGFEHLKNFSSFEELSLIVKEENE